MDFAGRKVTEDYGGSLYDDEVDQDVLDANFSSKSHDYFTETNEDDAVAQGIVNPLMATKTPTYIPNDDYKVALTKAPIKNPGILQDKSYQELSDNAKCLSMHQPWASLLIKGIKMHEGRTW